MKGSESSRRSRGTGLTGPDPDSAGPGRKAGPAGGPSLTRKTERSLAGFQWFGALKPQLGSGRARSHVTREGARTGVDTA